MEIVLIRHGEPEWVRDGLNVVDPPLTERGHRQAECVSDALDGDAVIVALTIEVVDGAARRGPSALDRARLLDEHLMRAGLDEIVQLAQERLGEEEPSHAHGERDR